MQVQWRRIDPLLSLLNLDNEIYIYLTDQSRKFPLTIWKDWKLQTVYKEHAFCEIVACSFQVKISLFKPLLREKKKKQHALSVRINYVH